MAKYIYEVGTILIHCGYVYIYDKKGRYITQRKSESYIDIQRTKRVADTIQRVSAKLLPGDKIVLTVCK